MTTTDTHRNICPKCQAPISPDAPGGLCPKCVMAGAGTITDRHRPGLEDVPSAEQLQTIFPQLEIIELIGRGGMGFVFKARQLHLDREVALKLLPEKLGTDPHFAERFTREARVLAKLNHPNIVMVHDFGHTSGFYYLTMEYVEGLNLRQAMRMGKFSPAEALAIVPKICNALQFAHEQGVLHRDIKPENILLDAHGRVKIADFGIAKIVGEEKGPITLTGTGASLGTPHYMAPEQFENPSQVDHRADIYSLGVVFYEMLTGELPLGRFAAPSARTDLDERIDAIVLRALAREREHRQKDARELQTEVETVASTQTSRNESTQPGPSQHRTFSRNFRHKLAWSGAALVFLFMAFVILAQRGSYRQLRDAYASAQPATVVPEASNPVAGAPVPTDAVYFAATNAAALEDPAKTQRDAEAIALAREQYETTRFRHSSGTVPTRDLDMAHRDLLIAEARGDARKIGRAHYDFAVKEFGRAREKGDPRDIWQAANEMSKAQHGMEIADAGTNQLARAKADLKHAERAYGEARRFHLTLVEQPGGNGSRVHGMPAEDLRNFENEYLYAKQRYEQVRQNQPSEK